MRIFMLLSLCVCAVALAQNRTGAVVLESSVVPTGGDITITADGGCEGIVRIAPIADQRPSKVRRYPKEVCESLKKALERAAKLDQGVGNGAKP